MASKKRGRSKTESGKRDSSPGGPTGATGAEEPQEDPTGATGADDPQEDATAATGADDPQEDATAAAGAEEPQEEPQEDGQRAAPESRVERMNRAFRASVTLDLGKILDSFKPAQAREFRVEVRRPDDLLVFDLVFDNLKLVTGETPRLERKNPSAPAVMVVEMFLPSRSSQLGGDRGGMIPGSNPAGQTAPSYLMAPTCSIFSFTDLAALGVPDMHLVQRVVMTEPTLPCPWDCGDGDGSVGIVDFLALLSQWGSAGGSCDFNGSAVGIVEFLELLGNWGNCP